MTAPYFADDQVQLYLGDCREVLPALGVTADCILADPPYGETSLRWDRWPDGWLEAVTPVTSSLWCFGSMRMFLDHAREFAGWKLSQDVIWEKQNGSGPCPSDRFMRVHEHALHWYQGNWSAICHLQQRVPWDGPDKGSVRASRSRAYHETGGRYAPNAWSDDGTRVARSVLKVQSMHQRGAHETEKPVPLLMPLIAYACPPGGLVVAPFAGSGSDLEAARMLGMRAIGIEADERECEKAARRLAQGVLAMEGP